MFFFIYNAYRRSLGPIGIVEADSELDALYSFFKKNPLYAMQGSIVAEEI